MASRKMICPKCGNEMNHHADKLIYSSEGQVKPRKSIHHWAV